MSKYRLRRIGVASNASAIRPTLSDCIEQVLGQSDALAGDVLDALKAWAAQPAGDREQDDSLAKARLVAVHLLEESESVRATLTAELRRVVYQSGSQDFAQSPLGRVEDIHVFDIKKLEAHIEHALARQEVIRAVDDVLHLFDALVSALLGWTSVQSVLNPLKPEAFVRALQETIEAWVPDEAVRVVLLRPAAIAMGVGLRQLYREACEWMRSQGIDPVEQPAGKLRDGAMTRLSLAETEVERTMVTLDRLRRLLAGESLQGSGSMGVRDFTHTVPASLVALQDLKLVEPMMKRLAQRTAMPAAPGIPAPAAVMGTIPTVRSQAQNQQIGRELGVEVVRFMLDQLVQDDRLMVPVRMQLRALEPVMVRLANADPRFFIDRVHPARQFIDRIVQRSLAYSRDDDEGVTGFVACVANAVDVLSRGPGDADSCAAVLEALEQDWEAFSDMRRRQQEEVQNARQHAEQRMVLAQRFSDAMMERFKNGVLPELVASFLRGPWSQVLAESHLRSDGESADPRGYLALVDDLAWSVQLPLIRRDYARLVRLIPRLLGRLSEGLVLIRYPQEPISIFLDQLSALHDKVMDDHRRAVAAARGLTVSQLPLEIDSQVEATETSEAEDAIDSTGATPLVRRPRARAPTGAASGWLASRDLLASSWVDLLLGGEWVRAQLSWISHNRSLYMFVSSGGLAHTMTRRTMDRLELQGRIVPVATDPVAVDLDLDDASVEDVDENLVNRDQSKMSGQASLAPPK